MSTSPLSLVSGTHLIPLHKLIPCIPPGSIVSIAGGSGSGKSTLANLLVRYYDPSAGRILYGDENIRDYTPESWRNRIAIVPQDPALFSTTIAENSASPLLPSRECHSLFVCSRVRSPRSNKSGDRRGSQARQLWIHRYSSTRIRHPGWISRSSALGWSATASCDRSCVVAEAAYSRC